MHTLPLSQTIWPKRKGKEISSCHYLAAQIDREKLAAWNKPSQNTTQQVRYHSDWLSCSYKPQLEGSCFSKRWIWLNFLYCRSPPCTAAAKMHYPTHMNPQCNIWSETGQREFVQSISLYMSQSMFHNCVSLSQGWGGAGADPGWHWARGRGVANSSKGQFIKGLKQTTIHARIHTN